VPATGILDREGNLRFRIIGQSSARDLETRIRHLLTGHSPEPDELLLPKGMSREHFEEHHAEVGAEEDHHEEEHAARGSEVPS
jgi:hypothetical protein